MELLEPDLPRSRDARVGGAHVLSSKTDARRDRVEKAKERLAAIEPKLARMSIVVPEAIRLGEPTLEIVRDGVPLGRAAWNTASPVDPGAHVVEVRAKGKKPARIELSIASGRVSEIVVPVLESAPAPREPAAVVSPAGSELRTTHEGAAMRTTGVVVGSIGLAAIGTGIYFGARALTLSNRAQSECPSGTSCTSEALEHNADASSSARISNVAVIGGAVMLGGGVLVYLLAPRAKTTVVPYAGATGGGAVLTSSF